MTHIFEGLDLWTTIVLELRQPMTAVKGQAQRAQLLLETDPRRANEAIDQVVEQIARLDRLLDELPERMRQEERNAKALSGPGCDRVAPLRR
jgi:signal transduction histidine kinase